MMANTDSGKLRIKCAVGTLLAVAAAVFVPWSSALADVLLQSDSRAIHGERDYAYFFIEAEDFHTNDPRGDGASWLLSSEEDALLQTVHEEFEPDPWAYSSGGESITNALFTNTVTNDSGGGHDVQYLVQFDTPGSYYLYIRQHSPLGPTNDRNKNDSFYYPIEFGEDPTQNKANGDDYGLLEAMMEEDQHFDRGPWVWFAARTTVENGEQVPPIDQNPATFLGWNITPDMLGQTQILEFDHREDGVMLDAFLFIETTSGIPPTNGAGFDGMGFTGFPDIADIEFGLRNQGVEPCDLAVDGVCDDRDIDAISAAVRDGSQNPMFDLNNDGIVDGADRLVEIEDPDIGLGTLVADGNLDRSVDGADFDTWLANRFTPGGWGSGDYNGDGTVDGSDFNEWNDRKFTSANGGAAAAVPEPSSLLLLAVALLGFAGYRRAP